MILNVREAQAEEVQDAWPLYSEFVQDNLFNGGAGRASRDQWNEKAELVKFTEYWNATAVYMVEIDDKTIGWIAIVETLEKITIENMFLTPEWQNKGVAERLFKEMTPIWRNKGQIVDVALLKDAPVTPGAMKMLRSLGYKSAGEHLMVSNQDDLTHLMRAE